MSPLQVTMQTYWLIGRSDADTATLRTVSQTSSLTASDDDYGDNELNGI